MSASDTNPELLPALVHSRELLAYNYGPQHPLQTRRLLLTRELIDAYGLGQPASRIIPATCAQMALFHDPHYLEALLEFSRTGKGDDYIAFAYGLGINDNPAFPGLWEMMGLIGGASLRAMELVVDGKHPAAFAPSGGLHHGHSGRAAGFCYINDIGIMIKHLLKRDYRVAYVDLDAHHGDGVQWPFYENNQVLTISIHQHPETLFPGTGLKEEMGRGLGLGHTVNVPLWPDSDDEIYITCFEAIVPPLLEAFKPDYIITQLGVDASWSDPMANLNITTRAYAHCVRRLKQLAWGRWIATGGGGYNVLNVAKGWALAWAIMCGYEDRLPAKLPAAFCVRHELNREECYLRDQPGIRHGRQWLRADEEYQQTLAYLLENLLPRWGY